MLKNCSIMITGGTGSFGNAFVARLLDAFSPKRIVVFSRDEMKQEKMAQRFLGDERLRFFIGDVREKERLARAMAGVDFVIHAAALKIVPTAEYNPFECIKTNVIGAMNVIDAALDSGVKRVIALSTDKASSPINIYGASKLASDRLFISSNSYSGGVNTRFSVVRYGNVMGSRGSVIPLFCRLRKNGELPITDPQMTRFMITLEQGVDFVMQSLREMSGGEIFVKKIPSMNIKDIAYAIAPEAKIKIIGVRPGEKIHEQMISVEEAKDTIEYDTYFKIISGALKPDEEQMLKSGGRPVSSDFCYNSLNNKQVMSQEKLKNWIMANQDLLMQKI